MSGRALTGFFCVLGDTIILLANRTVNWQGRENLVCLYYISYTASTVPCKFQILPKLILN